MNSGEYQKFLTVFMTKAGPILSDLQTLLAEAGYGPMAIFDLKSESYGGLGLTPDKESGHCLDRDVFVRLMLEDLSDEGLDGVGLRMDCSVYATGILWAPGCHTPAASIECLDAMGARLEELHGNLHEVVQKIEREWARAPVASVAFYMNTDQSAFAQEAPCP